MIPEEKSESVRRAFREAFGVTDVEEMRSVAKGLSSDLVYRIVVNGSPYVLRIVTRLNEQTDPQRQFACMQAASEAGITPRVWYANVDDGICISEYIEPKMFPIEEALVRIPVTLRRLHSLAPFPKEFNWVTAHKGFICKLQETDLLPKDQVEEVFSRYDRLCSVYLRVDGDMVSCNCNLKPENIVFDGQHVWLMNWQAAFVNDRYFDLAIAANYVIASDEDECRFLKEYFGQTPDEYQLARFFTMRQVTHMLAAAVFLLLGSAGKAINRSGDLPSFRELHKRHWNGNVDLADEDVRSVCGRVYWEELLKNVRQARFDETLRILSGRHAGPQGFRRLLPVAH